MSLPRPTAGLLLAALLAVAPAKVSAHSKTETTTPADGATVSSVEAIEIRFDAPMRVTAVSLENHAGDVALQRDTGTEPTEAFRARPDAVLEPGDYRLEWRGLSADGHPMQGAFGFTIGE